MFQRSIHRCFLATTTPVLLAPKKKKNNTHRTPSEEPTTVPRYAGRKTLTFKKNHEMVSLAGRKKLLNPSNASKPNTPLENEVLEQNKKKEILERNSYAFLSYDDVLFPWTGRSVEERYKDFRTEFLYIDRLLNATQDISPRNFSMLSLQRAKKDVLDAVEEPVVALMRKRFAAQNGSNNNNRRNPNKSSRSSSGKKGGGRGASSSSSVTLASASGHSSKKTHSVSEADTEEREEGEENASPFFGTLTSTEMESKGQDNRFNIKKGISFFKV